MALPSAGRELPARTGLRRGGRPGVLGAIGLLGALIVGLAVVGQEVHPFGVADFPPFTVLLVAAAFSAGLRFGRGGQRVSFSFTTVLLLAAIPLVGPVGAMLLGIGAAVLDARQGWWAAWVFNGMMFGVSAGVASLIYAGAGGSFAPDLFDRAELVTRVGIPLLLADLAFCLANLLILLAVSYAEPGVERRTIAVGVVGTLPLYLAWAVVAFVLVALWGPAGAGPVSVPLVLVPLIVTRHVHDLFAGERKVRSSVIDALARAGREDGAEAHGERVHRYALAITADLGVRPTSALEYTARLHGVGMGSACSSERLLDPGSRDEAQRGAASAAEILSLIDFLDDTCAAVGHQAEWFDGSGGPDGLADGDIPLDARILAVADAADVLIFASDAVHPEAAAIEVLRQAAGRRFDPEIVEAFARVVGRPGPRTRRSAARRSRRSSPRGAASHRERAGVHP